MDARETSLIVFARTTGAAAVVRLERQLPAGEGVRTDPRTRLASGRDAYGVVAEVAGCDAAVCATEETDPALLVARERRRG